MHKVKCLLNTTKMPKLAIAGKIPKPTGNGKIVIVTGGTSDMPVAEEAATATSFRK